MRRVRWARLTCLLAVVLGAEYGRSQALPQSTADELHAMTQQASVIFTGQVLSVERHEGSNGGTGMVAMEFAVEDAVRGIRGSTFTLNEWAGLWPAGEQPFRVGQRFLMLLHAPGPSGLSSPVGGSDGAIPIFGAGEAPLLQQTSSRAQPRIAGDSTTPVDVRVVDLRWVGTRVARAVVYRQLNRQTALPVLARANVSASIAQEATSATSDTAVPVYQSAPYASVLAALRTWEKDVHAAR
jgi:hypothetical protein